MGLVFCDDGILKVPSKYSMDTILKKYNKRVGKPASVDSVDSVDKILEDREKTHGDFRDHAYYSQSLKRIMRESENYDQMLGLYFWLKNIREYKKMALK